MTGMDGSSHDRRDLVARRRAGGPLALRNAPLGTGYVRRSTEASKQGEQPPTVSLRASVQPAQTLAGYCQRLELLAEREADQVRAELLNSADDPCATS